ncbi:MAG: hypothetical protein H6Q73_1848 [Firmicutes bacterium]|nr:hypothetical protein [Bacillota bacterium]
MNITKSFGNQSVKDSPFQRKARLLQSFYRTIFLMEDCGNGPSIHGPLRGNMLKNGEVTGKNFLSRDIFEYAINRVNHKKEYETIDSYRLFNNMLSSQPMCFNLFYPLMAALKNHNDFVTQTFQQLLPHLNIAKIIRIEIEFIPPNYKDLINDKSAFDAFIEYQTLTMKTGIIGIETKYTDVLGLNTGKNTRIHPDLVTLFTPTAMAEIEEKGCCQLTRNFLLTETYRIHTVSDASTSIILAPKDEPHASDEFTNYKAKLQTNFHNKIVRLCLEDFVDVIKRNCPTAYLNVWIDTFYNRYLNFDLVSEYFTK